MDSAAARVVRAGYDAMAARYLAWSGQIVDDPRRRFLQALQERLVDGSEVVDLGCGAGVPCTALLAERHRVVGIDISFAQLRLAAQHAHDARYVQGDIASLNLRSCAVDAVTAFYSLIHVPRDLHAALLERVARWLRPGGWLLAALSASGSSDGVQDDFLGVPMFFSGWDAETNRHLVRAAGFEPVMDEVVTIQEPDGPAMFWWVLARRAAFNSAFHSG